MYQVITIGSALVDIFIHSDQFKIQQSETGHTLCHEYGDKMEMDSFKIYTGGGASNTAVSFARLGFKTAALCETGQDHFGSIVLHELAQEEVDTNLVVREKLEQTGGSVILVGEDGGRTVMVYRGASSMLDPFDMPTYWLTQSRWIHLSSISGREATLKKIFTLLKHNQTQLSWNPGKAELGLLTSKKLRPADINCSVFFVNQQEWEMISNVQADICRHFSQVVVTNGSQGGTLYLRDSQPISYQSEAIKSVDDTGAGDAFASAYCAAIMRGKSPREALTWGKKNASSVIGYFGAKLGLLRRTQLV